MRKRFFSFLRALYPVEVHLFLLCLFLLLWALIAFDLHRLHNSSAKNARTQLHNLANVYAEEVASSINAIDYVLIDLRDQWHSDPTEFAAKVQERQLYLDPSVAFNVGIIDRHGKLIFSSYDWNVKPVDLSDRAHFQFHRTHASDALYISKPVLARGINRWAIQFTRPLRTQSGEFGGVMVLSVSPEYFSRFHQTIELGQDSSIALARVTGELLSRSPNPDLALGKSIADAPFLNAQASQSGFFQKRSEVDGIERLYAWRILANGELVVILGQSTAAIFKQYYWQRTLYFWSGGVISFLLLLAGYFLVRYLRQRAQDRAAIRQMEKALQQSQKMEALGNLTGGVAHDFNNILQIISGNTQMLKFMCSGEAQIEQRLDNTLDAVDRGAKLSSQLLTFARRQPLRPAVIHLGALIQNIDGLIQRLVGSAINLRIQIAERLWHVKVDSTLLENVLLNLAANARDAMQDQGTLTIKVTNASIDPEHTPPYPGFEPGEYVELAITDTGSGMSPEVVERAFEPFFTTKPEGKGTGLGLAMAYGFVRESGGRIYIDSTVGVGTTVRIFLPRTTEQETELPPVSDAVSTGGTETVLLVEDDVEVQAATESMLTRLGYTVLTEKDADSALAILEKNISIDVLFTDVVMPGSMDGLALARQTKLLRPEVAILLTSGYLYDALEGDKQLDADMDFLKNRIGRKNWLLHSGKHFYNIGNQGNSAPDAWKVL